MSERIDEWMNAESGLLNIAGTNTVSNIMPGHRTVAALVSEFDTGAQPETTDMTDMSLLHMETETAEMHPGDI